jgi:DNA-nicking Smr family endonuclease
MNEDDKSLFRQAVTGAKPLDHGRHEQARPRPPGSAAFRRADERAVLDEALLLPASELGVETGEEILFRTAGVSDQVLRNLRRGRYAIADELDLHGLVAEEAREVVRNFLAEAAARGRSCVRIIHGKGHGSGPRGPVLKKSVNLWLRKHDAVLAFCSARAAHGGTGAIYVLLRR